MPNYNDTLANPNLKVTKVNCNPQHKDYHPKTYGIEIYLNGELQVGVTEANSDTGVVTRYKLDVNNELIVKDGEYVKEQVRGNVCIFIPEDDDD